MNHPYLSNHNDGSCDVIVNIDGEGDTRCGASPGDALHQGAALPLDELLDLAARRGVGVVRATPGDTLVLLMPDDPTPDDGGGRAEQLVRDLNAVLPQVGVIAVVGIAGAIVVPPNSPAPRPDQA